MSFLDNQFNQEEQDYKGLQEKLGINKISAKEKKALLEKFLEQQTDDGGGKKKKKINLEKRRKLFFEAERKRKELEEKRKRKKEKESELGHFSRNKERTREKEQVGDKGSNKGGKNGLKKLFENYLTRIRRGFEGLLIRMTLFRHGYFSGVSNISKTKFKLGFLNRVKNDLTNKLKNMDEILKYPLNMKEPLRREMFKEKDELFYDLVILYKGLYNRNILNLFENYTSKTWLNSEKMRDLLRKLYRHLYIYREYYKTLEMIILTSIDFQWKLKILNKKEKDKWVGLIVQDIRFIFVEFLSSLHDSYCWILGQGFDQKGEALEMELEVEGGDQLKSKLKVLINNREAKMRAKEEARRDEMDEKEQEKMSLLNVGQEWIEGLSYTKEKIDDDELAYYFNENDKIFHTYIILEEFEKELSFILTSNKLKFKNTGIGKDKIDIKGHFNNLYIEVNQCHDKIKSYLNLLKKINQFESDKVESNYYNKHLKGLIELKKKDNRLIRNQMLLTSQKLLLFVEKVLGYGSDLEEKTEMESEKIYFDSIDGDKRKLEGKDTKECLTLLMYFMNYFIEKLKNGNLSGIEYEIESG